MGGLNSFLKKITFIVNIDKLIPYKLFKIQWFVFKYKYIGINEIIFEIKSNFVKFKSISYSLLSSN